MARWEGSSIVVVEPLGEAPEMIVSVFELKYLLRLIEGGMSISSSRITGIFADVV
jgi:hypothetical protein